jgi:anaerobic magnesium-protoporphyrin IX monomethyl ester cyclase
MEELRTISALGTHEIFFNDLTFGVPRGNAAELCRLMKAEGFNFGWTCFSRVDSVDDEMLALMKQSGCHTIIFGVESASEPILKIYHKGYTKADVIEMFNKCRRIGIKTVATFILGLPEDTQESCLETIEFSKAIHCDYASFNIAVPRPGTGLRQVAVAEGLIEKNDIVFDHSGQTIFSLSRHLSNKELERLKKKAIREFYFRPSYLLTQIAKVRSFEALRAGVREFFALIANNR